MSGSRPSPIRFTLVTLSWLTITLATTARDDAPISGVFKGNGKEAKLAYLSAKHGDKDRKGRIILLFTEKDPSKEKDPETAAMFGRLDSALIITIKPDGKITGCHVAHSAHGKGGFTSLGEIEMKEFKLAEGKIQGKLTSGGEQKAFGETWEVDLKFSTKMT